MEQSSCPICNKPIPDYRLDNPYCECGWGIHRTSADFDEAGWLTILGSIVGVSILQIFVLFFTHNFSTYALAMLNTFLASFIDGNFVVFFHFVATVSLDIFLLSILYASVVLFLGLKSSNPIWISAIFGVIVISFKLFVIDPWSGIGFTPLAFIENILLFAVTIAAGIFANHLRKKNLNWFKSGSKVS